jgi:sugar phosphate isomerase/epimerase
MRIGISTTDFPQMPASLLFGQISEYGFGVIQLGLTNLSESRFVPDGLYEIPETIDAALIRAASSAKRYGLDIAALNGTFNMAYPDQHARDEGVRRFGKLAGAAAEIGCGLITLCSGTRNKSRLWAYHPGNAEPAAWADMMDTLRKLTEIAERHGLTLALETEASNVIDTSEKAARALCEINSDKVAMIMDCANLFRPGEAKRENVDARIRKAFDLYGNKIALAHGKDVQESDGLSFCAAGEGIVNYDLFIELLNTYKYPGDMILHGIYDGAKMKGALEFVKKRAGERV